MVQQGRYIGSDKITPVAQANHPLRAVKAALGIRKAMTNLHEGYSGNGRLSFGIGIHGGTVVLGLLDIGQRMEYSAVGECLSITGRIQEQARPGQILVSAQVFQKVSEYVYAQPVEPVAARVNFAQVDVYEVLELKE